MAHRLASTGRPFQWMVRPDCSAMLPEGYLDFVARRGMRFSIKLDETFEVDTDLAVICLYIRKVEKHSSLELQVRVPLPPANSSTRSAVQASLAVANTSFLCKRARARHCRCDAMVEVAGMIASAVGNQVASKLGELVKDEIALLWGFKDDVDGLREKMEDLQAVLLDADQKMRRGDTEGKAVGRWLAKFKDVAYDVEDVLDDLDATALVEKTQSKV
ncbi:hypothetical protein TRIUR3_12796 [Triticum urartu]|uniref:Disease resistance N-terminal domain-containing protein n=1 Tax=Triticum urartu TaxID=4572 RepID=M7ZTG6_TRIUA|nr:hypothetical protein TRIUR3_12796 [Triticum urartu]